MIAGAPAAGKGTQCQKIVDKVRDDVTFVDSLPLALSYSPQTFSSCERP